MELESFQNAHFRCLYLIDLAWHSGDKGPVPKMYGQLLSFQPVKERASNPLYSDWYSRRPVLVCCVSVTIRWYSSPYQDGLSPLIRFFYRRIKPSHLWSGNMISLYHIHTHTQSRIHRHTCAHTHSCVPASVREDEQWEIVYEAPDKCGLFISLESPIHCVSVYIGYC